MGAGVPARRGGHSSRCATRPRSRCSPPTDPHASAGRAPSTSGPPPCSGGEGGLLGVAVSPTRRGRPPGLPVPDHRAGNEVVRTDPRRRRGHARPARAGARPASRRPATTTAAGSPSARTATSTSPPATPGTARPRRTPLARRQDPARHRRAATPPPGNPIRGQPGVEPRAPQRPGPRLGRRRPALRERVRPGHAGRAQRHRARRQLRLAARSRAPRPRAGLDRPGRAVARPTTPRPAAWPPPAGPSTSPGCGASGCSPSRSRRRAGRPGEPGAALVGELGRLRHVAVGPDGALWVLTHNTDGRGRPAAGRRPPRPGAGALSPAWRGRSGRRACATAGPTGGPVRVGQRWSAKNARASALRQPGTRASSSAAFEADIVPAS